MGEILINLLNSLSTPELVAGLVAIVVAIQTVVRVTGEFLIMLGSWGKFADDEDWMDSAGAFLRTLAGTIGKGLQWFGIGGR